MAPAIMPGIGGALGSSIADAADCDGAWRCAYAPYNSRKQHTLRSLSHGWRRSRNDRGPQPAEPTTLSRANEGYKSRVGDASVLRHVDGRYVAMTFNRAELNSLAFGEVAQPRNRLRAAAESKPSEWIGWTLGFYLGRRWGR
jgi:hypothetical protein